VTRAISPVGDSKVTRLARVRDRPTDRSTATERDHCGIRSLTTDDASIITIPDGNESPGRPWPGESDLRGAR